MSQDTSKSSRQQLAINHSALRVTVLKFGDSQRNAFENVRRKVQQDGGRARFGWMFHYRVVADIPGSGYLIAVHHAVWHAPNGYLIDITPFHPEPKHRPLSSGGDVLFLVDDSATPVTRERLIAPLPSRFYPLSADERLITHVQQLVCEEEQECRQIYEDSQT